MLQASLTWTSGLCNGQQPEAASILYSKRRGRKMRLIQIDLTHWRVIQNLLSPTIYESGVQMAIISRRWERQTEMYEATCNWNRMRNGIYICLQLLFSSKLDVGWDRGHHELIGFGRESMEIKSLCRDFNAWASLRKSTEECKKTY